MHLSAPAKVNLHLRVGPRRDDGFHPLLSWMCTVGLFDTIEVNAVNGDVVALSSDAPDLPTDERNLIVRAASALRRHVARTRGTHLGSLGARLRLDKRIPHGAGLGGGSSDAATTLVALNRLWQLDLSMDELSHVAAQVGSDVPFFLHGASCACAGRGEIVRPIAAPVAKAALLILPPIHVPTPAVYRRFDEMGLGDAEAVANEPEWARWAKLPAAELLPHLVNDLEAAAFDLRPDLGELRRRAESALGRIVRMSGSGSSLFTIFDSMEESRRGARLYGNAFASRVEAVELAPRVEVDPQDR